MRFSKVAFALGCGAASVAAIAPTDSIQDADPAQSGYLPNHNMQPATVDSAAFGILWSQQFNGNEAWYAKPLVYTPSGQKQLIFTASAQNNLRSLDALTGAVLNTRNLIPPFLQSDIGCGDIPNTIGVIGTPVLDPATDTVYLFAKGYAGAATGVLNGRYWMYAVNVLTLQDVIPPVLIDGHAADNDPTRYFVGGTILQRPALAMVGNTIYAGFGGHCDLFNYTGMIVGVSKTAGVGVVTVFAMESSPGAPSPQPLDYTTQNGGKAGIWQSGMGLATDGTHLYFATGNGQGHVNQETPASGKTPLSTLDEAVVNLRIDPSSGKVSLADYFEPYEYVGMDAGDRDLGSGGVALLDPTVFKGTNGVSRLAVTIGKNGKMYVMNADNLGGFKQGSGATDAVIQTIIGQGAVFGGSGSYPLDGGYIYFNPTGFPLAAYKLGLDASGNPQFTPAGSSPDISGGGTGVPTTTSYKDQAGSGIVWICDSNNGLRAYYAVPPAGSTVLKKINLPPTGGLNKFQRPVFGDSRLYVSSNSGKIMCLGSPVALPLSCSSPVDFGAVTIGSAYTQSINCTTLIALNSLVGVTSSDRNFWVNNSTLPSGALAAGTAFSFPVIWNLTQASLNAIQNVSYGVVKPGAVAAAVTVYTNNAVLKYSGLLPVAVHGSTVSKKPFLSITPPEVDFGGIVVGGTGAQTGLSAAMQLSNLGSMPLSFTGFAWTLDPNVQSSSAVVFTNTSTTTFNGAPVIDIGDSGIFTSSNFPTTSTTLAPGGVLTVPLNFFASTTGSYASFLTIFSNAGMQNVLFVGSASTAPIANISVSTTQGGWDPNAQIDFGNVLAGTTSTRTIRICNSGGSQLQVTKSKPPISPELFAEHPTADLHEGQFIPPNACALGPVDAAPPPQGPNRASHVDSLVWVLNTDDINFTVHEAGTVATVVTKQVGPLIGSQARYQYLGCYYDGMGRNLASQVYSGPLNENGYCQNLCFSKGFAFAGTQYHTECWCGNPTASGPLAKNWTPDSANKCAWSCPGDVSQPCGGPGTYMGIYYDTSKYTPGTDSIPASAISSSSTMTSTTSTPSSSSTATSTTVSNTASSNTTTASTTSNTATMTSLLTNSTTTSTTTTLPALNSTTLTTSTTLSTSTITSAPTTTTASATATLAFTSSFLAADCFADHVTGHAMHLLLASDLMTPEYCIAIARSALAGPTPTTYRYAGIEYGRECYAATAAYPSPTALVGGSACRIACKGNTTEFCGGRKQFNLYYSLTDASGAVVTTAFPGVSVTTVTTGRPPTPT